jgi:8-oxo-dGTP pyrophosphatase MutT (NUDIX family)
VKKMRVRHEVQAVIFDEADGGKHVLILKKKDFSAKRHRWRLLKGGVNEGETEVEALQREIFEEAGLRKLKILDRVNAYQFVFRNVRHVVSSYLVKADRTESIKLQESEVDDYLWTNRDKALRMLHWSNERDALKQLK